MDFSTLESKIREMVDALQGLCSTNGLSNQASEEEVVTSVFLYKFLNDKFEKNLAKFAEESGMNPEEVLDDPDVLAAFTDANATDVAFGPEDTIKALAKHSKDADFADRFDAALLRIAQNASNQNFSLQTADGSRLELFGKLTTLVSADPAQRNHFAAAIFGIITKFDFADAFGGSFDFFSAIFEYLIKNYNVASGTYAEYFTPQAISDIVAKILAHNAPANKRNFEICDPAAGSGSLILHLARELGEDKTLVYSQDISQKSVRFLRLNMLLNNQTKSLGNIVRGDTLLNPFHFKEKGKQESGLKQFDYITTNPPFKTDFSSTRNLIENKWNGKTTRSRFFAGIPKIPNKKKESMAIYLMFIQHVLYSLKKDGKAAIVVPTGFLTAKSGIELTIREELIKNHMLRGVVSMPSNIFANTGTNVSVLFIDKANATGDVVLMDASKLGKKVKDGDNQRTVLSKAEVEKIINTFNAAEEVDDFSVLVSPEQIAEKGFSFSAGQYFEVKIEHVDITPEEFEAKMTEFKTRLAEMFAKGRELEESIMAQLGGLEL